jgi:hypothetical protein
MRTEVGGQNRDCRPHRSLTLYERKKERFNHSILDHFPYQVRSPDSAFRNSTMSDSSCLVSFRGLILVDSHLFLCPPLL